MADKHVEKIMKEKEIYRDMASIKISKTNVRSMTDFDKSEYEIRDKTSALALKTYKKLKAMKK